MFAIYRYNRPRDRLSTFIYINSWHIMFYIMHVQSKIFLSDCFVSSYLVPSNHRLPTATSWPDVFLIVLLRAAKGWLSYLGRTGPGIRMWGKDQIWYFKISPIQNYFFTPPYLASYGLRRLLYCVGSEQRSYFRWDWSPVLCQTSCSLGIVTCCWL